MEILKKVTIYSGLKKSSSILTEWKSFSKNLIFIFLKTARKTRKRLEKIENRFKILENIGNNL